MKKVISPQMHEEVIYYSDFSGKHFGQFPPPVVVKFAFNYGSKFDGGYFRLDLSDEEAEELLDFIKSRLVYETKQDLEKKAEEAKKTYEEGCAERLGGSCEELIGDISLIDYLLDKKQ